MPSTGAGPEQGHAAGGTLPVLDGPFREADQGSLDRDPVPGQHGSDLWALQVWLCNCSQHPLESSSCE